MSNSKNIHIILTVAIGILLLIQAVATPISITGANIVPVVEFEEVQSNNVIPTVNEPLSTSFYSILEDPGLTPIYWGGEATPAAYSYIEALETSADYGKLDSDTSSVNPRPTVVPTELRSPDQVAIQGWGEYSVPCAVQLATDEPDSLFVARYQPISLHYDYSLTFEAKQGNIEYPFLLWVDGPTILKTYVRDADATIGVTMYNYTGGQVLWSWTYSAREHDDLIYIPPWTGLFNITVTSDLNIDSLVTLAPLRLEEMDSTNIPVNASIEGAVKAPLENVDKDGNINYIENSPVYEFFSADIIQDREYRIAVNLESRAELDGSSCCDCSKYSFWQVAGNTSWVSGSYNQDGYTFRAQSGDTWMGVLMVWADTVEYTIYFQDLGIPEPEEEPTLLATNIPINITDSLDKYFTFTLDVPSIVAFNYTGIDPALTNIYHQPDADTRNYIYDYNMDPKSGNLTGDYLGQLYAAANEWLWLPAGNVIFQWKGDGNTTFEVFTVPVETLNSAQSLSIDQSSIFAFELPTSQYTVFDLLFNNTDHVNQSIQYEWGIYHAGNEDPISSRNFEVGNYFDGTTWQEIGWGVGNDTIEYRHLHYFNLQSKILLIRPYTAWNETDGGMHVNELSTFSGTLRAEWAPLSPANAWVLTPYEGFWGYYVPQSLAVTPGSTQAYVVNDDISTSRWQIFGIPLSTTAGNVYNVTATIIDMNADFDTSPTVSSGNIGDGTFLDVVAGSQRRVSLFIADSSNSMLYFGIDRTAAILSTSLMISLTSLDAPTLSFTMPTLSYEYDSTISPKEVEVEKEKEKKDSPGFLLLTLFAGLSTLVLLTVLRRRQNN